MIKEHVCSLSRFLSLCFIGNLSLFFFFFITAVIFIAVASSCLYLVFP